MTDTPLTTLTDAQRVTIVQESYYALFETIAHLPGAELLKTDRLSFHNAFPPSPFFRGVWNTHLAEDEIDPAIEDALAWFKARNAPNFMWWFGPGTNPPTLADRLVSHGFQLNLEGSPSMVADLHALNEFVRTPEGFEIVRVTDRQRADDWGTAFLGAYGVPEAFGRGWVDAALSMPSFDAPWRLYVGYWNGKPVATNLLFMAAGVAGLFAVGTVAEARGQGIGAAITLKPLIDARELGYHFGVLSASEMGYPVYRRLGFVETPGRVGRWIKTLP